MENGKFQRLLLKRASRLRKNITRAERILYEALSEEGIPFSFQHIISPYIADFYIHSARLVVELDGPSHWTKKAQRWDHERDIYMREKGLEVIRFTNEQAFTSVSYIVERISLVCDARRTEMPAKRTNARRAGIFLGEPAVARAERGLLRTNLVSE